MFTYAMSNVMSDTAKIRSVLHFCSALQICYQLLHSVVPWICGSVHQPVNRIGVHACGLRYRADVSVCQHGLDLFECHCASLNVKKIA